jgi:hypothetical protein
MIISVEIDLSYISLYVCVDIMSKLSDILFFCIFVVVVVAWGAGKSLKIEEVEVSPPQAMEVRIKVHYTALYATQRFFFSGKQRQEISN